MKKPAKNQSERGASLVLVVFMMVVLVSFGILALTSASANMRLSLKTRDWRTDYYALDSRASDIVFAADQLLYEAEMEARDELLILSSAASAEAMKTSFEESYMRIAREKLEGFSYEGEQVLVRDAAGGASTFLLEITLESAEKSDIGQKYLTVQIAIEPPEYLFPTANLADARRADDTARYRVAMWMQWQEDFDYEYSNTYELWNGLLNGGSGDEPAETEETEYLEGFEFDDSEDDVYIIDYDDYEDEDSATESVG